MTIKKKFHPNICHLALRVGMITDITEVSDVTVMSDAANVTNITVLTDIPSLLTELT